MTTTILPSAAHDTQPTTIILTTREFNLLGFADAIITAATELDIDTHIAAAMPVTWRQGLLALDSDHASDQWCGYRLLLSALAQTPGAAQALVDTLACALGGHDGH